MFLLLCPPHACEQNIWNDGFCGSSPAVHAPAVRLQWQCDGSDSLTLTLLTVTNSLLFPKDLFAPANLRSHFTDFKWGGIQSACAGGGGAAVAACGLMNSRKCPGCFTLFCLCNAGTEAAGDTGSINWVQKLGDVSCTLEQFPAETNAAGQTSICGSEWGGRGWGRCREGGSTGFGRRTTGYLLQHWRDTAAWNVAHPHGAGQAGLLSVSDCVLCQRVLQLAEMKLHTFYLFIHEVW